MGEAASEKTMSGFNVFGRYTTIRGREGADKIRNPRATNCCYRTTETMEGRKAGAIGVGLEHHAGLRIAAPFVVPHRALQNKIKRGLGSPLHIAKTCYSNPHWIKR